MSHGPVKTVAAAPPVALLPHDLDATTPVKHVVVINWETAPCFGQRRQVLNILSEGIINADGSPGPNVNKAQQFKASVTTAYSVAPTKTGPYPTLPPPNTGGTPEPASDEKPPPFATIAEATAVDLAEHGFTLLEVLVAFVIAALALAVLFHAGLSGLQAAQSASHYEQAVARARSHLALAVNASPLVAGDWQGDDGRGFTWHLRVAPTASTSVRPAFAITPRTSSTFPLTLYMVTLQIGWHDGDGAREVRLDTDQIGQAAR